MNEDLSSTVQPAPIRIPAVDLTDLRGRLSDARWPDRETVDDRSQGVQLELMQALCDYWQREYDWRRCEEVLNSWNPQATMLDGLRIVFFHIRSPEPDALPMIMTHGWPGSIIEFNRVVGPLTNPVAHGGEARDAFHLVLPCLPGYGFSEKPSKLGWNIERIARAWATLMARLGYQQWVAQGGDWGAAVTSRIAAIGAIGAIGAPDCVAIHLNTVNVVAHPDDKADKSPDAIRAHKAASTTPRKRLAMRNSRQPALKHWPMD